MNDSASDFSQKSFRRQDLAALAFIVALVLLFFWRIITPHLADRAIFPPGDFSDQFWAFRMFQARAFAQGRLPLWSDNFNSGHPFLADVQSAVFYPVSLIWTLAIVALRGADFTLLDLETEAIFHFVLAGAFTYLFARQIIGSRVAALGSALTFMFGGYLTSYPPLQLAILETATWLPLALLFIDLGFGPAAARSESNAQPESSDTNPPAPVQRPTRRIRYLIVTGLVLGVAALAGHPQTFLFVVYACAIYFAWCLIRGGWRGPKAFALSVLPFALTLLVAAGIAAAQWIPTLEYQGFSTRAGISWAEASGGFPTIDPLQMILPGFTSAFQSPLYIGVFPLWLAAFALFVDRTREKLFWALLALGSLFVAFGAYVFVYALFYLFMPGFAMFRDQERLAFVVSFALSILAGFGFHQVIQPVLDAKRVRRAWALLPAGFTITAMMTFALFIAGAQRASGRLAFLTDRAGLMVLLFGLASLLVLWRVKTLNHSNVPAFVGIAVAFIAFDLFTVNSAAYNASPDPRYPVTPIIQTIQNDPGIFRVVDEGKLPGHFGIAYGLEEIGGISPLRIAAYNSLLDVLPEEKLWPLLNVRYAITARPGFANAEVVKSDGDTQLLRLGNSMPRAWFVPYVIQNAPDDQVLAAMSSGAFDPWQVAYIAGSTTLKLPAPPTRPSLNHTADAADFQSITPEHSVVIVRAPADGLVVMSENYYYPGWRALVNGEPTSILRADIALAAVPVRAGEQKIELFFDPGSVKIGIGITLASLLVALAGLWMLRR
jgi:hypothetical protein